MVGKYDDLARSILEYVGGKDNINSVTHCITRVRFKLRDEGKADTEAIGNLEGVIKVMQTNGQYQVVVGNKVEDVYEAIVAIGGLVPGGEVEIEDEGPKTLGAIVIDLISGIFQPMLGAFAAAGIVKGLLALVAQFFPAFADDGAYTVLYTAADGMFYFLPVVLALTASRKFRMNEFAALAIGFSLVYPTTVALTGGEVIGSVDLGFAGTFSWYTTFLGLPLIMPAAGYTSSVIPVILMVWFGSKVEHWAKRWMPASVKMFFVPLVAMVAAIVFGYLVIGPVATLLTNLVGSAFMAVFSLPVVGSVLGSMIVGGFWMCLVIFGFHWSLTAVAIVNLTTLGYDFILPAVLPHSFALGAVLFAMYLKNKDTAFRGIALPAMISSFFFGITEPAIYGVALPDKKAFVVACLSTTVGSALVGLTGALGYMTGGLGVFSWLCFIDPGVLGNGITHMIWAIAASLLAAVVGFVAEFATYKAPEK